MFKATFQKEETKTLTNGNFKKFTFTNFQSELISKRNSRNSYENFTFEKSFVEVSEKYAPKRRTFFVVTKNHMLIKHYVLLL